MKPDRLLYNSMLKKNMFILHYVQSDTYLKALSIIINEDHKSPFSLFLVYILTFNYKDHIPKKSQECILLKLGIYMFHWKKVIKNDLNQN